MVRGGTPGIALFGLPLRRAFEGFRAKFIGDLFEEVRREAIIGSDRIAPGLHLNQGQGIAHQPFQGTRGSRIQRLQFGI